MRLGNILKQVGGTPESGRRVKFQLRVKLKNGTYTRREAEATLLPVSVSEVAEIQAEVADYLAENPSAIRDDEINLRYVVRALKDSDNLAIPFALPELLPKLSEGLTVQQVAWLLGEYTIMIRGEYPECWASAEEREKAEDEAEGFTEDDQV